MAESTSPSPRASSLVGQQCLSRAATLRKDGLYTFTDDFILSLARRFVTDACMDLVRALDEAIDDYKHAMSSVSFSVDISETDRKYLLAELTDIIDGWPK